jgi:hypothetical protein
VLLSCCLRHYYGTVANNLTLDWKVRLTRQLIMQPPTKKIQPHDGLSCPSCTTAPACKPTESTASILYQQGAETASCCQHSCALAQLSQPNNTYVLTGLLRTCFAVWLQEALQRQSRPSADALGLNMDPFTDSMSDLDTLDLRLEYVAAMMQGVSACR